VQRALYLLFNEGYHTASGEAVVRAELCGEAMRLTRLLLEHPPSATPATHALAALMHLHAARLPARTDATGELHALDDQDRGKWDRALLAEGIALLEQSATGTDLTAWHVEAAIAAEHAGAGSVEETDWNTIVALYDRLMRLAPSPVVALNRAIAIGERDGADRGLEELESIAGAERLASYPFHRAAMGELELRRGNPGRARAHFTAALGLARNAAERRFFERRLLNCPD